MKRLLCYALACGCGAGNQGQTDMAPDMTMPVPVQLAGAVQKGPFVLGSTVQVATVDASGNPTGQVFPTQTSDDLGDFSLTFTHQGNVSIEGSGFYPGFSPSVPILPGETILNADLNADRTTDIVASVYGFSDLAGRMGSMTTILINAH